MQRRPSPKASGEIVTWPWRTIESALGSSPVVVSTSVSAESLARPVRLVRAAVPAEFTQPAPTPGALAFAHGQSPNEPSPTQIGW